MSWGQTHSAKWILWVRPVLQTFKKTNKNKKQKRKTTGSDLKTLKVFPEEWNSTIVILSDWPLLLSFWNTCLIGFKRKKSMERCQNNHLFQIETNIISKRAEFPIWLMFKNHKTKYGSKKLSESFTQVEKSLGQKAHIKAKCSGSDDYVGHCGELALIPLSFALPRHWYSLRPWKPPWRKGLIISSWI